MMTGVCRSDELAPKTTSLFLGHELMDPEPSIVHHFSADKLRNKDLIDMFFRLFLGSTTKRQGYIRKKT